MDTYAKAAYVMAEDAECLDALMPHYSTDYIFGGVNDTPYIEADKLD